MVNFFCGEDWNALFNIKTIFIIILLTISNMVCCQNIVIKYVGSSDVTINLTYNFRELSNSYTVLNKENRYLVLKSNKAETIMCNDILRNTLIYAEPKDTIELNLNEKGHIIYSSKKSAYRKNESELINLSYEKYGPIVDFLSKRRIFLTSKQRGQDFYLDDNFEHEKVLLEEYYINNLISNQFYNYFKSLYWSLSLTNKILNTTKAENSYIEIKKSFNNANYLINIPEYRLLLLNYTFRIMKERNIKSDLYNTLLFISENFPNQNIIDYLLYNKMKFWILYKKENIDKKNVVLFQKKCKNLGFIQEINKDLSSQKESLLLSDILKKFQKKLLLVDFWASWCLPCIEEFAHEKKLMKKYPELSFAFISIDKSWSSWKNTSDQYPDILNRNNNFLLEKTLKDLLFKQINISTIPRYILVSKEGKIINFDAPRPSDPELTKLIEKHLKITH